MVGLGGDDDVHIACKHLGKGSVEAVAAGLQACMGLAGDKQYLRHKVASVVEQTCLPVMVCHEAHRGACKSFICSFGIIVVRVSEDGFRGAFSSILRL